MMDSWRLHGFITASSLLLLAVLLLLMVCHYEPVCWCG
jgi:hypothetical protein